MDNNILWSRDYLDDVLEANKTHLARLNLVQRKIPNHRKDLTDVTQAIMNVLSYYGIDLKQESLIDDYNKAAAELKDTLEELGECLIDIGDDVTEIFEKEIKMLEKQRELLDKMSEKAVEELFEDDE